MAYQIPHNARMIGRIFLRQINNKCQGRSPRKESKFVTTSSGNQGRSPNSSGNQGRSPNNNFVHAHVLMFLLMDTQGIWNHGLIVLRDLVPGLYDTPCPNLVSKVYYGLGPGPRMRPQAPAEPPVVTNIVQQTKVFRSLLAAAYGLLACVCTVRAHTQKRHKSY